MMTTNPTILLADDDEAIRRVVTRVLSNAGYTITGVADGDALLHRAFTLPCDLVLTDVSMPVVDGLTAIRLLRAEPQTAQLPIIAMSADPFVERDVSAAGANAFLVKPFLLDELLCAVERALQRACTLADCHPTKPLANQPPPSIMAAI